MEIIKGDLENFDNITSKGDVLVDFFATWCGALQDAFTRA